MEAGAAHHEKTDTTDAALRSGLRAIDATRLPAFDPMHTRRGRTFLLTYRALELDGGVTFEVVAIAPQLVDRVEAILARPDGDACLERLARWCKRGGLDA